MELMGVFKSKLKSWMLYCTSKARRNSIQINFMKSYRIDGELLRSEIPKAWLHA